MSEDQSRSPEPSSALHKTLPDTEPLEPNRLRSTAEIQVPSEPPKSPRMFSRTEVKQDAGGESRVISAYRSTVDAGKRYSLDCGSTRFATYFSVAASYPHAEGLLKPGPRGGGEEGEAGKYDRRRSSVEPEPIPNGEEGPKVQEVTPPAGDSDYVVDSRGRKIEKHIIQPPITLTPTTGGDSPQASMNFTPSTSPSSQAFLRAYPLDVRRCSTPAGNPRPLCVLECRYCRFMSEGFIVTSSGSPKSNLLSPVGKTPQANSQRDNASPST